VRIAAATESAKERIESRPFASGRAGGSHGATADRDLQRNGSPDHLIGNLITCEDREQIPVCGCPGLTQKNDGCPSFFGDAQGTSSVQVYRRSAVFVFYYYVVLPIV
jgi:hypothetical protein